MRAVFREAAEILVLMAAPMMPHLAEECWAALGHADLAAEAPWPVADPALVVEDTMELSGAGQWAQTRRPCHRPRGRRHMTIEAAALALEAVQPRARRQARKKGHHCSAKDRECRRLNRPFPPAMRRAFGGLRRSAGCSIQPLYGPLSAGGDVAGQLQAIAVDPIPDRLGHYLDNDLIFGLNGTGAPVDAKYRLKVTVSESSQAPLLDTVTGYPTASNVVVSADYQLAAGTRRRANHQGPCDSAREL